MAKTTEIINGIDVQDKVQTDDFRQASLNDVGYLAQVKDIVLKDNLNNISPFFGGILIGDYKNSTVIQTQDGITTYSGSVKNITFENNRGLYTAINSEEFMAILLQFRVEETDIFDKDPADGLSKFSVKIAASVGSNTVQVQNGTGVIPKPSFISFDNTYVPRYQVIKTTEIGGNTSSITLDRALELGVIPGQKLRVAIPVLKTIPGAIKDALETAGINNFDTTFDELDTQETANGNYVWLNIRSEQNISLTNHIGTLLDMGNYFLITKQDGNLSLFQGLLYQANGPIGTQITESDIIPPYQIRTDDSKLIIGYSYLYVSGITAQLTEDTVSTATILKYKAKKRHVPIAPKSTSLQDYQYLFYTEDCAKYYGRLMLAENKKPKWFLTCGLKEKNRIFNLGDECNVSIYSGNQPIRQQPLKVYSYNHNLQKSIYDSIEFVFTNQPDGIIKTEYDLRQPKIVDIVGITNGCTVTIKILDDVSIIATVFMYDGHTTIFKDTYQKSDTTSVTDGYELDISDASITSGNKFYLQLQFKVGTLVSKKTEIINFIAG